MLTEIRMEDTYRLLVPVKDVLFGEEAHAVHQTHFTVALLSTNIDAFTSTHTHTQTNKNTG